MQFRQHGDQPDEWNEGQADRIEYDSAANQVRLIGSASLKNLTGTVVTQSIFSETITCDTARDTVSSAKLDPGASQEGRPRPQATVLFAPRLPPNADPASASAPSTP